MTKDVYTILPVVYRSTVQYYEVIMQERRASANEPTLMSFTVMIVPAFLVSFVRGH
jgi:hypothetical protein